MLKMKLASALLMALPFMAGPLAAQETPGQGGSDTDEVAKQIKKEMEREMRRQMGAQLGAQMNRPERGKGTTVAGALKTAGKYTTFLAIAERAGFTPLLSGKARDTSTAVVNLISTDSLMQKGDVKMTTNIEIKGAEGQQLPPQLSVSELKNQLADAMSESLMGFMASNAVVDSLITVFAPTDSAFAKLSKQTVENLKTDSAAAAAFVRRHVVNKGVFVPGFMAVADMQNLGGSVLKIKNVKDKALMVNGVSMVEGDLVGENGVAHGIEAVIPAQTP